MNFMATEIGYENIAEVRGLDYDGLICVALFSVFHHQSILKKHHYLFQYR